MTCKRLIGLLLAAALLAAQLPALAEDTLDVTALYKNKDVDGAWSAADAEWIDLNGQEGQVLISGKGDYVLSGTLSGQIVVDAPENEKVRLILNGVTVTSPQGPAIYEKQADKLIVTLAEGSENFLTDGPAVTDEDDVIGAALYAEDDLSINGNGSLTASGTQKHGIQSKADLIIAGGKITVTAQKDGLRGRNSVLLLAGEVDLTVGGDGITATRADAEGKGWVVLSGGSVTVKSGDGAGAVRASANSRGGFGGRRGWDDWGASATAADSGESQKAVKAATDLTVLNGNFTFNCADDGLHAVNVTVAGGVFSILSGDDGMHADEEMKISGGVIDIAQCYEGIEGKNVTISGGDVRVTSSDDGVNVSGGSDGSGFGGWGRGGGFAASGSGGMLTISGGSLSVNAGGDGLDSNGSILISGGVVGVWAATTAGEGAIDFNGSGTVSGGTLIVASTGGVMRDTLGLTGQSIMALSVSGSAGETVILTDQAGAVLGSFTPGKAFDTLLVSSASLQSGQSFIVRSGDKTLYSGAATDSVTSATAVGNGFDSGFGSGRNRNRKGR